MSAEPAVKNAALDRAALQWLIGLHRRGALWEAPARSLPLSPLAMKAIKQANVATLADLMRVDAYMIIRQHRIGSGTLREIRAVQRVLSRLSADPGITKLPPKSPNARSTPKASARRSPSR
jgi:hypothetical protein